MDARLTVALAALLLALAGRGARSSAQEVKCYEGWMQINGNKSLSTCLIDGKEPSHYCVSQSIPGQDIIKLSCEPQSTIQCDIQHVADKGAWCTDNQKQYGTQRPKGVAHGLTCCCKSELCNSPYVSSNWLGRWRQAVDTYHTVPPADIACYTGHLSTDDKELATCGIGADDRYSYCVSWSSRYTKTITMHCEERANYCDQYVNRASAGDDCVDTVDGESRVCCCKRAYCNTPYNVTHWHKRWHSHVAHELQYERIDATYSPIPCYQGQVDDKHALSTCHIGSWDPHSYCVLASSPQHIKAMCDYAAAKLCQHVGDNRCTSNNMFQSTLCCCRRPYCNSPYAVSNWAGADWLAPPQLAGEQSAKLPEYQPFPVVCYVGSRRANDRSPMWEQQCDDGVCIVEQKYEHAGGYHQRCSVRYMQRATGIAAVDQSLQWDVDACHCAEHVEPAADTTGAMCCMRMRWANETAVDGRQPHGVICCCRGDLCNAGPPAISVADHRAHVALW